MSKLKKILTILCAMIIAINCLNFITVNAAGSTKKVGNAWYTITSEDSDTAEYKKPANKNLKTAEIPDTVKIGRKTYSVNSIGRNAFEGCKKLKKVTIGCKISEIGENAFYGCKNLKTIIIKSTMITNYSVKPKAFRGLNTKAVATVPLEKLECYKAILRSNGFWEKGQKVKGKTIDNGQKEKSHENSLSEYINTSSSYFEKEIFNISTGDTATSGYSAGDTIPLYTEFRFTPKVYGHWKEDSRKLEKGYVQCARCGKCFTDFMLAFHDEMELSVSGGCWSNYYIAEKFTEAPTTWAFIPDKNPCKVVLKYTFPQGISYKDGSIKVTGKVSKKNLTDSCKVNFSGNQLVITIDDIKSEPFYKAFKYDEYLKDLYYDPSDEDDDFRQSFIVRFDAEVGSTVGTDGIITAAMSYAHKDSSHTDSYNISFRTASMQISNTDASGNNITGAEFDIYQKKTRYPAGSNMGTSDWELFKSGVYAGDVITGMGTGTDAFDNQYKVVQTKAPDGYEKAYNTEFELFISENGTVTAENEEGDELEVRNGVVQVSVVNEE